MLGTEYLQNGPNMSTVLLENWTNQKQSIRSERKVGKQTTTTTNPQKNKAAASPPAAKTLKGPTCIQTGFKFQFCHLTSM